MKCAMCSSEIQNISDNCAYPVENICSDCSLKLPSSLCKACTDSPFDYALGLKNGLVVRFGGASIRGTWVHLTDIKGYSNKDELVGGYIMDRGIDISLSEIVWCADAPEGS